jgi:hypothetical protein
MMPDVSTVDFALFLSRSGEISDLSAPHMPMNGLLMVYKLPFHERKDS